MLSTAVDMAVRVRTRSRSAAAGTPAAALCAAPSATTATAASRAAASGHSRWKPAAAGPPATAMTGWAAQPHGPDQSSTVLSTAGGWPSSAQPASSRKAAAAVPATGVAARTRGQLAWCRSTSPAQPVPNATSRAAEAIAAAVSRSTCPVSRPPRPVETRMAAGTMPAAAPARMVSAAFIRNRGRSSRPRSTGVPSSQSAVDGGTVTGPRQSASRTSISSAARARAASPAGAAWSTCGVSPSGGGGCRSARTAATISEPP